MLDQIKLSDISSLLTILVMLIIGLLQFGKYRAEAKEKIEASKMQQATAAEKLTSSAMEIVDERKTMLDEIKVQLNLEKKWRRRLAKRVVKLEAQLQTESGERYRENKTCRETIAALDLSKQLLEKANSDLQIRIEELARQLSAYINKEINELAATSTAVNSDVSNDRDKDSC